VGNDQIPVSRIQQEMKERHGISPSRDRDDQLPTTSLRKNRKQQIHRDQGGRKTHRDERDEQGKETIRG